MDLDGTLLRSDLLYESVLALLASSPLCIFLLPFWLLRGKAALKREIASRVTLPVEWLPYDARVLGMLRTTRQRPRVLCSASDQALVEAIALHLGVFEEVMASDGRCNLAGPHKAEALKARFGAGQYDYMGNANVDLHVWKHSAAAYVVNAGNRLATAAARVTTVHAHWPSEGGGVRSWIKALRVYQWSKNLLVLVPLLTAHRWFDPVSLFGAAMAFIAFGLCASGVYLLNDLLDLTPDRQHARKRRRPFAAGDLPLMQGLLVAPLLTLAGFTLALLSSPAFTGVLFAYYAMTLMYSLVLKRIVMIDVVMLAALYTLRIIGGAIAIGVDLSFWLLAFSLFMFLSLALVKRYTELAAMSGSGRQKIAGRGYDVSDLSLIQSLGAAAGYVSILVFALYINSPDSLELYRNPRLLWLLCPVLLFWIGRIWIIAHRGGMHDDPIVFAARDQVSWGVALVSICIIGGATLSW
ncbi:UbiA family prenyltransferase [Stenotrophomonas maltophilia]|nr:UbiA family prenyltransferase [Stenotrophomonas maltophilia]MCU1065503.1 UbiA family prenyltransferase [Stenotrophomonas maltophilia]MCU1075869.1 UbiA family prenyltransferase [Stenotrophomonas maltophilia]MCU1140524.1 UbiA family prenyltransferase [Stenotrophomonas maltophilia]